MQIEQQIVEETLTALAAVRNGETICLDTIRSPEVRASLQQMLEKRGDIQVDWWD